MKYILVYRFRSISPKKRLEFNRKLYGYSDSSNFGNYTYLREGILKRNSYKKLARGVILLDKKPKDIIKHLKKYKAIYQIFRVVA